MIVAAWVLCAETEAEAERLASSSRMAFAQFFQGTLIQVPPVDVALQYLNEHGDAQQIVTRRRRALVGTAGAIRSRLEALAAEYEADEVMVVTITYSHAVRRHSYELLAEAFSVG